MKKTVEKTDQKHIHSHEEHHHSHADTGKSCCGDCKGQGSCGKVTKVSSTPETPKDIATAK